jgi:hypothetical protein
LRPYTNIQKYSQVIPNFLAIIDEFEVPDEQKEKLDVAQQSLSDLVIDINQIIYHRNPSLYELIQIHQLIENSEVCYFLFIKEDQCIIIITTTIMIIILVIPYASEVIIIIIIIINGK